ncbi:class I SAM-dependent methyltransferase [Magnetospirillum sp. SS-4]|uniref:class I SAM-dependent methyltransferase n=1 Tax=Magnetospirillum sp. SS-4 TaxID=2681465 RepID=UPI001384C5DD|nr:class I SAM-dependent methyltransferase [Magnetospirillum sp. SS-4]CAA7614394.1 Menaquinone biosynthesis methlytransferase related protein [Magnetospirillum sp. SS-4]
MEQQEQTRNYFRAAADDWQAKATGYSGRYSLIDDRNRAALAVAGSMTGTRRFLDVGCGTGQLVIAAARNGLLAEGIDFADEMIGQCEINRQEADVTATFSAGSVFETEFEDSAYDIISAQGLIEYFSPEQMTDFFRRCHRMLKPGGALAVGSRNRLFNAVSLNDFTRIEAELGTLNALVAEAITLHGSATQEEAFLALRRHERIDPQPNTHPVTGIPVDSRYQYSPADLIYRLRQCGFSPSTLYPVHLHALPLAMKAENPDLHSQFAHVLSDLTMRDQRVVPYSSTFVLDVRKEC